MYFGVKLLHHLCMGSILWIIILYFIISIGFGKCDAFCLFAYDICDNNLKDYISRSSLILWIKKERSLPSFPIPKNFSWLLTAFWQEFNRLTWSFNVYLRNIGYNIWIWYDVDTVIWYTGKICYGHSDIVNFKKNRKLIQCVHRKKIIYTYNYKHV